MDKIDVSVVVPVYNVEKYLKDCLDSLERQTLKNIEVIMVNDGSTDGSRNIAEEYACRNDNFLLIDRLNGGLSAARNTGMSFAKGKYIYFLDSDDYLVDNALELLYKKSENDNLDVLLFTSYTFHDDSPELIMEKHVKYRGEYTHVYSGLQALQKFIDNNDVCISCCWIFSRLGVIRENKLKFYEGIIHEDHLFQWQILSLSKRVAVLNSPLYCRRICPGSITSAKSDWIKKIYAVRCTIVAGDMFVMQNPEIIGKTTCWFMRFWANFFFMDWLMLDEYTRNRYDLKIFYIEVADVLTKYGFGNNIRLWLFYKHPKIFGLLRRIKRFVKVLEL
ncbi:glycosyltransferase [Schwartzia succinivorans]|jgi:glycosyltransferase involved in cell wall biosynthesis|uniref:Glycosyl transferase family 2 n=1 Tax=Schwartzia succinivorans DSM 10502 TaxID=1123243 RepID=A0A1M4XNZ4_9FIRM|nr:glycosyltransferase [Schwartzia succinivorans]SHE95175.1 Glycosyl transferase family 2 [Schwartzia succinivorans DSM 10502]